MEGRGSLRDIKEKTDAKNSREELVDFLENFNVRTVLTAHPTQFYPGPVLGIINDLTDAIRQTTFWKSSNCWPNWVKRLLSKMKNQILLTRR